MNFGPIHHFVGIPVHNNVCKNRISIGMANDTYCLLRDAVPVIKKGMYLDSNLHELRDMMVELINFWQMIDIEPYFGTNTHYRIVVRSVLEAYDVP